MPRIERRKEVVHYNTKEDFMWDDNKALRLKRTQFVVGSIDKSTGYFSVSSNPAPHPNYPSAENEAKRLAKKEVGKKFVILEIKGIASAVDVVVE